MGGDEPFGCPQELTLSANTEVLQTMLYFLSLMIERSGTASLKCMNLLIISKMVILFSTEQ